MRRTLLVVAVCGLVWARQAAVASDVDVFGRASTWERSRTGVTLCHIPPENPSNARTIVVTLAAAGAHLAHGDLEGECPYVCDGPPSSVPQTGQMECWDANGNLIDCYGTGQDGEYQMGVSVDPRFTDNGDGTVTDNLTGLIWLKDANCFGRRNWAAALSDANTLADGSCSLTDSSVAGDWRLPNVKELQSVIDYGEHYPALTPGHPFNGFSGVDPDDCWSSTSVVRTPSTAWSVGPCCGGDVNRLDKTYTTYVWPVRGGQ